MNRQNTDEALIRDYLLGQLEPVEQEHLERRLITEEACFRLAMVVEEDLLDQYLYGQLSGDEEQRFARRFLATPEGAEQLRLAASLKAYARRQRGDSKRQASARASDIPAHRFARPRWQSPVARYALAAAALVLVALPFVLAWQVWRLRGQVEQIRASQNLASPSEQELQGQLAEQQARNDELARLLQQAQEKSTQLEQEVQRLGGSRSDHPQPLIAALTLTPGGLRSSGQSQLLTLKPGTSQAQLHLLVRAPAYASYQAFLETESGKPVWASGSLKPQPAGGRIHLRLSLSAQLLSRGDYRLRLRGRTDQGQDEEAGSYYFRVAKE